MSPFIRRPSIRRTDRLLGRSVLFIVLGIYTATFAGMAPRSEAEVDFQVTRSLALDGSLALGDTPEAEELIEAARAQQAVAVRAGSSPDSDRFFSEFGVGQALVGVPFYYAGHALHAVWPAFETAHAETGESGRRSEYFEHLLVGWRNALLGALTAWLLVLVARRVAVERPLAWFAGISYAFTSYAWAQACAATPDVQATFCALLAYHWILQAREHLDRLEKPRAGELLGVGLALGLAFSTRLSTAPAVVVLAAAALMMIRAGSKRLNIASWLPGGRKTVSFGRCAALVSVPLLVCVALYGLVNHLRFGHFLDSGHQRLWDPSVTRLDLRRVVGLLVAPGRGLAWLAPATLLAPFGLLAVGRRGDRLVVWVTTLIVAGSLLPWAAAPLWHGGASYGPGTVLVCLPFLWVGFVLCLSKVSESRYRVLAVPLLLLGLLVQVPGVFVSASTHQDMAVQAAEEVMTRGATPDAPPPAPEAVLDRIQWDWGFAAPWAQWRILRHRIAELDERFPAREIFRVDSDLELSPTREKDLGFRHLAWVDFRDRLGVVPWVPALASVLLLLWGVALVVRTRAV